MLISVVSFKVPHPLLLPPEARLKGVYALGLLQLALAPPGLCPPTGRPGESHPTRLLAIHVEARKPLVTIPWLSRSLAERGTPFAPISPFPCSQPTRPKVVGGLSIPHSAHATDIGVLPARPLSSQGPQMPQSFLTRQGTYTLALLCPPLRFCGTLEGGSMLMHLQTTSHASLPRLVHVKGATPARPLVSPAGVPPTRLGMCPP